ncbi:MAG: sulfite exporter TauE/SafE family protein [Oscillospiraceae bacterium]|nr:sulfite exporter TauE/SafE family protein [Oscillospiraceae bacterium]
MTVLTWTAAFLTGLLASLGVGGGMVLILWLTAVMGLPQLEAQGINLIFFLPISLLSVIIHRKNRLISFKELVPALITGIAGAAAGCYGARLIGSELLGKIFAGFILVIGIKELFSALFGNNRE